MRRTLKLLQDSSRQLQHPTSSSPWSPHPGLWVYPSILSTSQQRVVLRHSLALLSSPSRTTSHARRLARNYLKAHPDHPKDTFLPPEAYEFEKGHFDGVITGYREMLVRPGMLPKVDDELVHALAKVYSLLPPAKVVASGSTPDSQAGSSMGEHPVDPPDHLIMHLLHLSSEGEIRPHIDHLEAFGTSIVGLSLGGERMMRFRKAKQGPDQEPEMLPEGSKNEFDVLLEPGDAYVQTWPLRTQYTHEVLRTGEYEGRLIGGSQRLSIMLRDKLPGSEGKGTADLVV
ncbi:BZ3500_MvSof-1268-A1-R1_Chr8-2g10105 [Microbotryum saponariae]|uniref:BZ3500_MvSof-1268-A1-R1_Chr8-2g10105 protein n=1 Tax=Microbotryum saponariae TaxID=289078 RepID=A0A2X0NA29_9BASI|nr:BZ3500_MvSof-1268-A1-R1_Chr8-2g10105 [Microbotryum saponariae]SDA01797.1 BZ3501_MvSof-1269-A2-R1_Chr8-2g09856 [Microbotryum saponariae]